MTRVIPYNRDKVLRQAGVIICGGGSDSAFVNVSYTVDLICISDHQAVLPREGCSMQIGNLW